MTETGGLRRRLGLADAVVVGAGSMIGAGVFSAWAPAARAAGTGLLVGLGIAAVVAWCNATSSARLAAMHPESGGTYVFGRRQLGPAWGHLAGWAFVIGKVASCVAIALTASAYLWPAQGRAVAMAAVVAVTAVNLGGWSRTVGVTKVLLGASIAALAVVVAAGWSSGQVDLGRLAPIDAGPMEVLRAGGLLFFAFAGYARVATLGEEVRDPQRTIPVAIPLALGGVLTLYLVVGVTALAVVPVATLAGTDAPLRSVVEAGPLDALAPVVRVGAGLASFGVLLNLIPGISRTVLAMARRRDLPGWWSHVDGHRALPLRAELTVAAIVVALITVVELPTAIAASGVAVLTYYAITNAAALTLPVRRGWAHGLAVVGLLGCVALAVALPTGPLIAGASILALGVVVRWATTLVRPRREGTAPCD